MNGKNFDNLEKVLSYMGGTNEQQSVFVRGERDRIARIIREARVRVKANKAANGGCYRPAIGA